MREQDDVVEFKSFAIGMAIAILYPLTIHFAGVAFLASKSVFILKVVFGVAGIIAGVYLRIPVLSTAIVVGGLITFLGAIVLGWVDLHAADKFWTFLCSLVLVSALAYHYESKKKG